jgi:hypothetical protein
MQRPLLFSVLCLFVFLPLYNHATHLRAGEITAERISCASLQFRITITVFIDTESGIRFGGGDDYLDMGDGSPHRLIPEVATTPRPDLGPNMGMASYSLIYTYSGYGTYIISYSEQNRNEHVVNMYNSVGTRFFVETALFLDPFYSCNQNLPRLEIPPIDRACSGVAFQHNPGAFDRDASYRDSLSYELAIPKQAVGLDVYQYINPNGEKFYLDFDHANELKNGRPTFAIDPLDGTLTWDAPGLIGEYNIAFRIIEWRKDGLGVWRKMSYVTRDMQIIVEECENKRPDLLIPNDTCVTAGTILEETILGIDPENDDVKIEVFSEVLGTFISPATYQPNPAIFQSSVPSARLQFKWETECLHVRELNYQVVFKITDKPAKGPKLVTFKTWRIKVVGPAPEWNNAQLDLAKRNAILTWNDYVCENALSVQVWRKVDGSDFKPDHCETGMPGFLGYTLVATVPLKDPATGEIKTGFVDTNGGMGLAPGAAYCYRLVALYPEPAGGKSYVSEDICLPPIEADAPVITNVTVEKTDLSEGAIRVKWYSPFQINTIQFPGPYQYAVYRLSGSQSTDALLVTPQNRITDTTFVDSGINTRNQVFSYAIVLYSNTATDPGLWIAIDTSAIASSVRLQAKGADAAIDLAWDATVPWSNTSERFPYHLVYRSSNENLEAFQLIDSVSVFQGGFAYKDDGGLNHQPPVVNQLYCYRVLTRGTYGNPGIHEPLENFSQVMCVKPDDQVKPCAPSLSITSVDCNAFFETSQCSVAEFSNRLEWTTNCELEVSGYNIYASPLPDQEFSLIASNVVDNLFVDKNLASFARCYKIKAVDNQGNESEWSEMVCNDNCPYFELPNVFTPNGDDCNEYFSAYGPFNPLNVSAPESCVLNTGNYSRCLRFVKGVAFRVYNRWGKEVYSYETKSNTTEKSFYINWDGRDANGQLLSTGVYYFSADVTFDVIAPEKRFQRLKGWVQVVR